MALSIAPAELAALKAITFHLSSTPPQLLPRTVAASIHSLRNCGQILGSSKLSTQAGGEAAVVVHRFLTQISALLQGRRTDERWTAAVLIKAAVDVGGYEILSKAKHWVSGLLTNLRRPDPPSLKVIYATTLTRIFSLTWPYPSLVREITTPSLPTFIKTAIANVSLPRTTDRELWGVLKCFAHLVPRHTTVFRSFVTDIRQLIAEVNGSQHGQGFGKAEMSTAKTLLAANQLQVLLHACEPKQGAGSAWESDFLSVLDRVSTLTDQLFFDIDEHFDADSDRTPIKAKNTISFRTRPAHPTQVIKLASQVKNSFATLGSFVETGFETSTGMPVKESYEVVRRILSVVTGKGSAAQPAFGQNLSTEVKDAVVSVLPGIHVAALEFLQSVIQRLHYAAPGLGNACIIVADWIFTAEDRYDHIRVATYDLLDIVLKHISGSLGKESIQCLLRIVAAACDDSLSSALLSSHYGVASAATSQPETLLKHPKASHEPRRGTSSAYKSAMSLITGAYIHFPTSLLPDSVRNKMDRAVLLLQHKDALLASVLHTPRGQAGNTASSLLPFLARQHRDASAVEALLRPRMPVIHSGQVATTIFNGAQHYGDEVANNQMDPDQVQLLKELRHGVVEGEDQEVQLAPKTTHAEKRVAETSATELNDLERRLTADRDQVLTKGLVLQDAAVDNHSSESSLQAHDNKPQDDRVKPTLGSHNTETSRQTDHDDVHSTGVTFTAPTATQASTYVSAHPGSAVAGVVALSAVEESDDDDFVIPELTMDVSDSDEEEDQ